MESNAEEEKELLKKIKPNPKQEEKQSNDSIVKENKSKEVMEIENNIDKKINDDTNIQKDEIIDSDIKSIQKKYNTKFNEAIKDFIKNNDNFQHFVKNVLKRKKDFLVVKSLLRFHNKDKLNITDVSIILHLDGSFIKIGGNFMRLTIEALSIMTVFGFNTPEAGDMSTIFYKTNKLGDFLNDLSKIIDGINGVSNNINLDITLQNNAYLDIPDIILDNSLISSNSIQSQSPKISKKDALLLLWMEVRFGINDNLQKNTFSIEKVNGKTRNIFFDPILLKDNLFNLIAAIRTQKLDKENVSFDDEFGTYEYQAAKIMSEFSNPNGSFKKTIEMLCKKDTNYSCLDTVSCKNFRYYLLQEIKKIVIKESKQNQENYYKNPALHKEKSFCPFQKAFYYLSNYEKVMSCAKIENIIIDYAKTKDENPNYDRLIKCYENLIKLHLDIKNVYLGYIEKIVKCMNIKSYFQLNPVGFYEKYTPLIIKLADKKFTDNLFKLENDNSLSESKVETQDLKFSNMIMKDSRIKNMFACKEMFETFQNQRSSIFQQNEKSSVMLNKNPSRHKIQNFIVDAIAKCIIENKIPFLQFCEIIIYTNNLSHEYTKTLIKDAKIDDNFLKNMELLNTSFQNMTAKEGLISYETKNPIDIKFLTKSIILLLINHRDFLIQKVNADPKEGNVNFTVCSTHLDRSVLPYLSTFCVQVETKLKKEQPNLPQQINVSANINNTQQELPKESNSLQNSETKKEKESEPEPKINQVSLINPSNLSQQINVSANINNTQQELPKESNSPQGSETKKENCFTK